MGCLWANEVRVVGVSSDLAMCYLLHVKKLCFGLTKGKTRSNLRAQKSCKARSVDYTYQNGPIRLSELCLEGSG